MFITENETLRSQEQEKKTSPSLSILSRGCGDFGSRKETSEVWECWEGTGSAVGEGSGVGPCRSARGLSAHAPGVICGRGRGAGVDGLVPSGRLVILLLSRRVQQQVPVCRMVPATAAGCGQGRAPPPFWARLPSVLFVLSLCPGKHIRKPLCTPPRQHTSSGLFQKQGQTIV